MNLNTIRSLASKILRLGLPILIGQIGLIAVGFADTSMVGNYSTEALAAASFVNNVFNTIIFTSIGFSYGVTPLVGMLFTQKRQRDIGGLMRSALVLNIGFNVLLTLIMTILWLNIHHLGQPEELLPIVRPYYLIVLSTLVPMAVFNAFSQWSYGIGRSKMPMWITLASNCINILGNYLLIYGHWGMPRMGLNGAGTATLIARLFCAGAILVYFFRSTDNKSYSQGFWQSTIKKNIVSKLMRVSWPVALQLMFESFSFSFAAIMAGWLGKIQLASYQIIITLGTLGFCVYYSLASAMSAQISNAAGQRNILLMRHTAFTGYGILLLTATLSSVVFWFLGSNVISLFTADPVVKVCALSLVVPLILYQFSDATQITFANALRGTGNVAPLTWISFVAYLVIGIPSTYLIAFTFRGDIYGMVMSFSISLFCAAVGFFLSFLRTTDK